MLYRTRILAVAAVGLLATAALPSNKAQAFFFHPHHAVVAAGGGGAGWPVWVLGGGVVSLMVRAAVVHVQECRELTNTEAMTGMVPVWPLTRQVDNRCRPRIPGCEAYAPQPTQPGTVVTTANVVPPHRRRIPHKCQVDIGIPVAGPVISTRY